MNARLKALKLVLSEMGIPDTIETVDDRKRVQKSVYIAQLSGLDLGYRFGWYLMGPYSPELTKDYYNLAEAVASDDHSYKDVDLLPGIKDRLHELKSLLAPPVDISLNQEQWLELVASYHYLRIASKQTDEEAKNTLLAQKPILAPFADQAKRELEKIAGLSL